MKRPLHKEGSIREMVAIALPMVVSQSCDTVMIFTSRFFLSKLQPEYMNAAMGGGLTAFMMMSFFIGLTGYSSALVAQYFGAGRKKDCPVVITQAIIFVLMAYLPILACRPLAHQFFQFMGVGSAQLVPQKIYFDILLYGSIIKLLRCVLGCFFSGIGRTGVVMIASFTAMAVNALISYVLIFGKFGFSALGIHGAAYAAIIGGASGLLVLAIVYFGKKIREEFFLADSFRFDWTVTKKLLRFGSSPGLELFLNILGFNAMVLTFHAHGAVTATAATIMLNWDMVSFVPLIGIEIAVTSMVGRFMGAGKPDIAHRSAMAGLKLGLIYSSFILILFVVFPHYLVGMFRPDVPSEVFVQAMPTALFMLRMAAAYVLADAMLVVFIGALRGAGDTFWAMCLSVSLHWFVAIALMISLRALHLTPEVSWVFMVGISLVFSFLVYLRYQSGYWRTIKVVESEVVSVKA